MFIVTFNLHLWYLLTGCVTFEGLKELFNGFGFASTRFGSFLGRFDSCWGQIFSPLITPIDSSNWLGYQLYQCNKHTNTHRNRNMCLYVYFIQMHIPPNLCAYKCLCMQIGTMMLENTNRVLLQCWSKLSSIYTNIAQRRYRYSFASDK